MSPAEIAAWSKPGIFHITGITNEGESVDVPYQTIVEALTDRTMKSLLAEVGAKVAIFVDGKRITRDVNGWDELKRQIVSNSPILLQKYL